MYTFKALQKLQKVEKQCCGGCCSRLLVVCTWMSACGAGPALFDGARAHASATVVAACCGAVAQAQCLALGCSCFIVSDCHNPRKTFSTGSPHRTSHPPALAALLLRPPTAPPHRSTRPKFILTVLPRAQRASKTYYCPSFRCCRRLPPRVLSRAPKLANALPKRPNSALNKTRPTVTPLPRHTRAA